MKLPNPCAACVAALAAACVAGCASDASQSLEAPPAMIANTPYAGRQVDVRVGRFDDRSSRLRGLFAGGADERPGSDARTTLVAALRKSGRFNVLDRDDRAELHPDAGVPIRKRAVARVANSARYVVTGEVTELGRRDAGDGQPSGSPARGSAWAAYARVTLSVVDPTTSEVVLLSEGEGEYRPSNRDATGLGDAARDAMLNGKALDLAILQAVDRLAAQVESVAPGGGITPEEIRRVSPATR